MIANGQTYKLLRQINALNDISTIFIRHDTLDIVWKKASILIEKQLLRNETSSRNIVYRECEEIF